MKNTIKQAFRQYVAGVADINERGEAKIKDEYNNDIFILFPNNNLEYALVREYWDNGRKRWEGEYVNNQLHGKCLHWYAFGQKRWEEGYVNGQLHGKCLCWYESGQKRWEQEYVNGKLINEKYY